MLSLNQLTNGTLLNNLKLSTVIYISNQLKFVCVLSKLIILTAMYVESNLLLTSGQKVPTNIYI